MAPDISSLEREAKLEVSLSFALPDLSKVVGRTECLPEQRLWAVYYDTPDLRLWQRAITLRHRTGEGSQGMWTLKLPQGEPGLTLDRTELVWSGTGDRMPDEAIRYLRGVVRRSTLSPIAELATVRRRLVLRGKDGRSRGQLDDDLVTVISGRPDSRRFRQLELELEDCPRDVVRSVLNKLEKAGARRNGEVKLAIALGLPATAPGRFRSIVGKQSSLGDVAQSSIGAGLDRLLDHEIGLRVEASSPAEHDVHQARVATRRLRSDLKLLHSVLDPTWVRHTRTELKWLGGILGRIRDLDVLVEALDPDGGGSLPESEGRAQLVARLQLQRGEASVDLTRALVGERYVNLLDHLGAASVAPPLIGARASGPGPSSQLADAPAATALAGLVGEQWRTLRKKVRNGGGDPSDGQLHQIRIKAKQLRYAAEVAAPVVGKPARRTAKAAEDLQSVLGQHHDAVNAEQWLRREALSSSPEASFSAGRLVAGQERRQHRLRHRWRSPWASLERKKGRSWLTR